MKKLLLSLMAFLLLTGFAFAKHVHGPHCHHHHHADEVGQEEVKAIDKEFIKAPKLPKPSFEGSTGVEWGIDFGDVADGYKTKNFQHGFKNDSDIKLMLPIYKDKRFESRLGSDVYVNIDVRKINFGFDLMKGKISAEMPKINAEFGSYGFFIKVYNQPAFGVNFAKSWKSWGSTKENNSDNQDLYNFAPTFDGMGTTIGYKNKDFFDLSVGVKLASNLSWDYDPSQKAKTIGKRIKDKTDMSTLVLGESEFFTLDGPMKDGLPTYTKWKYDEKGKAYLEHLLDHGEGYHIYMAIPAHNHDATEHKYAMGADFSMQPIERLLKIEATVNTTFASGNVYGAGTDNNNWFINYGARVSSKPIEFLAIGLGFDGAFGAEETHDWRHEVGFDVQWKYLKAGIIYCTPFGSKTDLEYSLEHNLAVELGFDSKDEGVTNLVPGFAASVGFRVNRLIAAVKNNALVPMGLKLDTHYKLAVGKGIILQPSLGFEMENGHTTNGLGDQGFAFAYKIGLDFKPADRITVFTKWSAGGKTRRNRASGAGFFDEVAHKDHGGIFRIGAKIAW